jgi:hypothetical protein
MYSFAYIIFLCLVYIQNTCAYFAYFSEDESSMKKYVIDDYIPEWNKKCYEQKIYRNVMCSLSTITFNCILYIECVYKNCSTHVIRSYQEYAKNNRLSGLVFYGSPAVEGVCVMPSTFIHDNIHSYVKYNVEVEFGYDDVQTTTKIVDLYKFGLAFVLLIFMGMYISNHNYIINSNFSSFYLNLRSGSNLNNNDEEEYNSENFQGRILINENYVTSDNEPPTCAICLESFEEGDTISKLSCDHEFKHECIIEWLKKNPRCPLCNSQE